MYYVVAAVVEAGSEARAQRQTPRRYGRKIELSSLT